MEESEVMQITPYLIAYHDRQDRAKRFTAPGFMARELASYHHARQREIAKEVVAGAVKVGTLKAIRKQIRKLLKQADQAQGEELRAIGARIEVLAKQAEDYGSIS